MKDRMETVEDVRNVIKHLHEIAGDDESAHSTEDELHTAVLIAIAEGYAEDPAAMAAEALRSHAIEFARWCA